MKTSRGESDLLYENPYDKIKLRVFSRQSYTAVRSTGKHDSLLRYKQKKDAANEDDYERPVKVAMGYVGHNRFFNED